MAIISCSTQQETIVVENPFGLSNMEQLTFEGDNGKPIGVPRGNKLSSRANVMEMAVTKSIS